MYVFVIVLIFLTIIATEGFAYIWHRFIAHTDYILAIGETHNIHHSANMQHEADEDFIWLLFLMILSELAAGVSIMLAILPETIVMIALATSILVLFWNWWIHRAYHVDKHWLNTYDWFRREKRRHYLHHYQTDKNYGIASHFLDRIMGTWIDSV